jgi:O-antigen/teichoic acid export membrane protein
MTVLAAPKKLSGLQSGVALVVLRMATNILLLPVLTRQLGPDAFGLFVLLTGLVDLVLYLDLGFSTGIVKQLSHYRRQGQHAERQELLSVAGGFFLAMGLGVAALGWLGLPWLAHRLQVPPQLETAAFIGLHLTLIDAVLTFWGGYCKAILLSHEAVHETNAIDMGFTLSYSLALVGLLFFSPWVVALVAARLLFNTARLIALLRQALRAEPLALRLRWPRLGGPVFRELTHFSGFVVLFNAGMFLAYRLDTLIVASFLPIAMVGLYEVVGRLLMVVKQFLQQFSLSYTPAFIRIDGVDDHQDMRQMFLKVSAATHGFALLLLSGLVAFHPELLKWLGNYGGHAAATGLVLVGCAATWSTTLFQPASTFLMMNQRHRLLSMTNLVAAIANLTLSVIGVMTVGVLGPALGTLIAGTLMHQLVLIPAARRDLNIGGADYVRAVAGPWLLPVGVSIPLLWGARSMLPWVPPVWVMLASGLILTLIYLTAWSPQWPQQLKQKFRERHP